MEFEKNTLLFGIDPMPRIVAVALGESGTMRVHRREADGSTITDVEPFHPFVWADSDVLDLGVETEKLNGALRYGWLMTVDSWKELIALRNGLKTAGRDFFAFTDPVQHYLTATGRTLFKDLRFEALKRTQIEVLSVGGGADPGAHDERGHPHCVRNHGGIQPGARPCAVRLQRGGLPHEHTSRDGSRTLHQDHVRRL